MQSYLFFCKKARKELIFTGSQSKRSIHITKKQRNIWSVFQKNSIFASLSEESP